MWRFYLPTEYIQIVADSMDDAIVRFQRTQGTLESKEVWKIILEK